MSSKSSSPQQQVNAQSRIGVSEREYADFMHMGSTLASGGDLLGLKVRSEQMKHVGSHYDDGIDILGWKPNKTETHVYERESKFKTVGQETLDKMMSMFSLRKKEVDQKRLMPGNSQTRADILNMG